MVRPTRYLLILSITVCVLHICLHTRADNLNIKPTYKEFNDDRMNIESLYEDEFGFLWIGSYKGIIKYDGLNYSRYSKVYYRNDSVSLSLAYSFKQLNGDQLLIGTHNQGLVCYNYRQNSMSIVPLPESKHISNNDFIRDIEIDSAHNIWLAFNEGILILDSSFCHVKTLPIYNAVSDNYSDMVYDLHQSSDGHIYCALLKTGIFEISAQNGYCQIFPSGTTFRDEQFFRITERKNGNLIFATYHSGIVEISSDGTYVQHILVAPKGTGGELWGLNNINDTVLCGGINTGLFSVPLTGTKTATPVTLSPTVKNCNISVTSIINDKYGNTWIGSHIPGLFKIDRNAPFKSRINGQPASWIKDEIVNCITEVDSVLWMGTDGHGLYFHDRRNNRFGKYTVQNGLSSNIILDIEPDTKGNLWLSTWNGGLSVLNTTSGTAKNYIPDPDNDNSISFANIKDATFINDTLWIATHGNGINLFIPESGQFIKSDSTWNGYNLKAPLYGNEVFRCSQGYTWVSTTVGLYAFHHGENSIFMADQMGKTGLYDNHITEIYEDSSHRLWIGTNSGLQYFPPDRKEIIRIPRHILPSGVVGIVPLSASELYISTLEGLYLYNTESQSTLLYSEQDGLVSNSFRDRAVYKTADGCIYWGTDRGISYKNTRFTKPAQGTPIIYIESAIAQDPYNNSLASINNHMSDTTIVLGYSHSSIDIHYGSLNIPNAHTVLFSYKLEGQDELFQSNGNGHINYSRLEPGSYTLIIRGNYNNQLYERNIDIHILPPFWQTWWFRILITAVLGTILYILYSLKIQVLKKQKLKHLVEKRTTELREQNLKLQNQSEELKDAYTELKEQSEELQSTNEELLNLNATQNNLMSILAHDLKNNFSVVLGFIELLQKETTKQNKYLPHIYNGVTGAHILLVNILSWVRSQANKIELKKQLLQVSDIINMGVAPNQLTASAKAISINSSIPSNFGIWADSDTVILVVRNLVHNAIKFSQKNSEIIISAEKRETEIIIEIKDYGIGMKKDVVDTLFKKSFSTKGTGQEHGSGLGLGLCKKFTELNNGKLIIESSPSVGTTCFLCFNAEEFPAEGKSTTTTIVGTNDMSVPKTFKKKNSLVLLVEDNELLRNILIEKLSKSFKVESAENGKKALTRLTEITPDVIITDFEMPFVSGSKLCQQVKENPKTGHIPVVLLTGMSSMDNRKVAMEAGADAFIDKVNGLDTLEIKIFNILETQLRLKNKVLIEEKTSVEDLPKTPKLIENLYQIIEDNYADPTFCVEMLAEKIEINRSNLYRKTKEYSQLTPSEMIMNFRLEKAKKIIETNLYSVAEVAYMTGFNAPEYFSRKFKAHFGKTPSGYRG